MKKSSFKHPSSFSMVLATLMTATQPLMAEEAPLVEPAQSKSVLEILEMGGLMMYPLIFLSIIAVVLILFYFFTIRQNAVVSNKFMNLAEGMIRQRDYMGLLVHCNRQNQSIARITEKTLDFMTRNPKTTFSEVREVAHAEGSRQSGVITHRISYLNDVGTIAPMVGLLGTVIGMISAFMEIANGSYEGVNSNQLAEGVYQALVTTASGLVIGIIAAVFYSVFRARVQKYISELEAAATHLLALISTHFEGDGGSLAPPANRNTNQ